MKKILILGAALVATAASAASLTGSGSSFVYPLFTKVFSEYGKSGDSVNYQSVGSGAGQKALKDRVVDFAATDVPIPDADISGYPGKVLTIPAAMGAVVISYNIPGVDENLKFNGKILADIYLGKTKLWNDAALAKLNPGVKLPALPITVAHRSDGSGTTGVFTDYLSKVSPEWKTKVGSATAVQWPTGIGAKGTDGVSGVVKSTPGAIGYIELTYALNNKIDFGLVQNRTGAFVKPTIAGVQAAAANVVIPTSGITSLTNASGATTYPISTFSYAIFYQEQKYGSRTLDQAKALKKMLTYVATNGQDFSEALYYAPLPAAAQSRARALIASMTFDGKKF
ncbi:phosphate ABC transporter substrate-binding protein PstS [Deinococcus sp. KNUC1210]|uniref:phosphate ABC transporter substrate-binding protein PstS n=1 Tax=Deinococcus sp. KNUC1210 TaxID=2917691 RepID=UPI001EEF8525|nr:phosphate ABC transporter substrate-binding protein PstS [Deinococcus sp. KNUC1210]ULH15154.1 phosphate ABC transporter substrate-binding protein PstS [Deinococcus sp. KNUC1210]